MNRILFFVHYNKYNGLSPHVLYLLEHIRHIYNRIVIISNSTLQDEYLSKLSQLSDRIIVRENKGFDFGAWKEALFQEGWNVLSQYDSLTLMNDTCFGPIYALAPVYTNMEARQIDFWGLTKHTKTERGMPGTNKAIPEHIQSYFLCFNKNVIQSPVFQGFWKNVNYETDVNRIIQKYEARLTSVLSQAGFRYAVFMDISNIKNINEDMALGSPDLCLKARIPLLKIKAFIFFPDPKYIIKFIKENTSYPISYIHDYFREMYGPNTSLLVDNQIVPVQRNVSISFLPKIAIHLHTFYLDVFEQYIAYFDNYSISFDLFITTDTPNKKKYIEQYINGHTTSSKLKEIIITENSGRNILPWLSIANRLNTYDIVGHFHTKKTDSAEEMVGFAYQKELFDLLLYPVNTIIEAFNSGENIGIIIPEIPYYFHVTSPLYFSENKDIQIIMNNFWQKLCCNKQIDFTVARSRYSLLAVIFCVNPRLGVFNYPKINFKNVLTVNAF
jgi:rhamnosyltransferase